MSIRCVALLSGGLDSMLAVRIMQEQRVEVEALNFKTLFTCCQDQSAQAARDLGVPLTVVGQDDDYLDLVRAPRFGYGKGANPCVDCRIYMFEKARRFMHEVEAQFVVSGEIIGQRPMSQKRKDLAVISHHSGLDELLLRPLSAKLLPPTLPERQGLVDREQLYAFNGRARSGLIELAKRLGLKDIPTPSVGCALTERGFARKVHDLIQLQPTNGRWDFEVLKFGRHFRFDATTKIIVGRNEAENEHLSYLHKLHDASSTASLTPDNFMGPTSLVIGPSTDEAISFAGGLVLRYSKHVNSDNAVILVAQRDETRRIRATADPSSRDIQTLSGVV